MAVGSHFGGWHTKVESSHLEPQTRTRVSELMVSHQTLNALLQGHTASEKATPPTRPTQHY